MTRALRCEFAPAPSRNNPQIARGSRVLPELFEVLLAAIREVDHRLLHLQAHLFELLGRQTPLDDDRTTVDEQRAAERVRNLETIPRLQKSFFLLTNATGTIGFPVSCAAMTTPGCTT